MEPAAPIPWREDYPPPGSFESIATKLEAAIAILEQPRADAGLPPLTFNDRDWLVHGLAFGRDRRRRPTLWELHKTQDVLAMLEALIATFSSQSVRDERKILRAASAVVGKWIDNPSPKRKFGTDLALAAAFAFRHVTGTPPGRSNKKVPKDPPRLGKKIEAGGLFLKFLGLVFDAHAERGVSVKSLDNMAREAIKSMEKILQKKSILKL
jgi:hypothetical protein